MNLNEQIAFSIEDLARRQRINEDSVVLVGARQVTWRSGALGCPEPGGNYTQALVPGVLILLKSGEETVGYHASEGGVPFFCPAKRARPPAAIEAEDLA